MKVNINKKYLIILSKKNKQFREEKNGKLFFLLEIEAIISFLFKKINQFYTSIQRLDFVNLE